MGQGAPAREDARPTKVAKDWGLPDTHGLNLDASFRTRDAAFGNGTKLILKGHMIAIIRAGTLAANFRCILSEALLLSGIGLRFGTVDGHAQGTIYTDRYSYEAALPSSTTIDFSGTPNPPDFIGRSSITVSGVTFTSLGARLFTGTENIFNFDSSYPVSILLPGGINAFGADFSGGIIPQNNPFIGTLTVNLAGGQTFIHSFTGQVGSWTFRGFAFSSPISSLVYNDGGPFVPGAHEEMLNRITFGPVPEPRTVWVALCAVAIWLVSRRCYSSAQLRR